MANKRKAGGGAGRTVGYASTSTTVPREFSGRKDADEWGEKEFGSWARGLTQWEEDTIENYTESAFDMNSYLRTGVDYETASMDARVMEGALSKASLSHAVIAYRGFEDIDNSTFVVGSVIRDKAFQSTSLSREIAKEFTATAVGMGQPVMMKVNVPKGTQAAYLNATGVGLNKHEQELLIQRNAEYVVKSVKRSPSGLISLEVDYRPGS